MVYTDKIISITAIVKDEEHFIREWVAYHKILGFDHFYIYDNDPDNNFPAKQILEHLDFVTVYEYPTKHNLRQIKCYNDSMKNHNFDWMALIDVDEYISLKKHKDIKSFLLEYKNNSGLHLKWNWYGDNGYIDDPDYVTEKLTKRMSYNTMYDESIDKIERDKYQLGKNILKKNALKKLSTPHDCRTSFLEDEQHNKKMYKLLERDIACVNHYYFRSYNRFMNRHIRGDVANKKLTEEDLIRTWPYRSKRFNEEEDLCMNEFVEPIKKFIKDYF